MRFLTVLGLTLCSLSVPSPLTAQSSANMTLLSRVPFSGCTTGSVWLMGHYMLLARRSAGFAIVDIRDPRNPVAKTIVPPGYPAFGTYGVGDIKSDGRYIYATDEGTFEGVFIYDTFPDPMNPTLVSTVGQTGRVFSCHNCWIDGNTLYAQQDVIDVTDKANPRWLGRIPTSASLTHDIIVLDNRAYMSNWSNGIEIWDVTNPRIPLRLGGKNYSNSATHNMWPSEDRRFLYTTDENQVGSVGGGVRVWNISNLANIQQIGAFKTGPSDSIVHNVYVSGDLLFVAYYKEGVRICSIKDPAKPVEIAHYDTFAPTGSGCFGGAYAGCWGAYPWRRDMVLVSDLDSGGYLLRLDAIDQTFTTLTPTVAPGGTIDLRFGFTNQTPAPLDAFGIVVLATVNGIPVLAPLVVDIRTLQPATSASQTLLLPLPPGLPTPLPLGFTGLTGTASPLTLSEQIDLTVTIQ